MTLETQGPDTSRQPIRRRRRRGFVKARQFEFPLADGFCLVAEEADDGARIQLESQRRAEQREAAAKAQPSLL